MCSSMLIMCLRVPLYPHGDSLMLAFDESKLSIVNFDASNWSLNTLSLHAFEDEVLRDGFTKVTSPPIVRADPGKRCAAMLVYGRHLAVFPYPEHSSKFITSYTIALRNIEAKLDNIIDMVFLHGYYEPTLLVVYEPIRTTAGRACIRYDTVCILAVSLNLKDQLHAVVWNMSGLPMSINQAIAIPQPVGGVCLFGANEVVYLNQSVPPCGLSLNSCADEFTRFPLMDRKAMKITFDACAVDILNDRELVVASDAGKMYHMELDVDISNAVRSIKLEEVLNVSIPHTLTSLPGDFVFLGSRLGDSQLLHYKSERAVVDEGSDPKHARLADNDEDDFLYGSSCIEDKKEVTVETKLAFSVVDTILNVGPCKVMRSCTAHNVATEFKDEPRDFMFDLATLSGHEKDSSMCFFQRTVRPDLKSSSQLQFDAVQLWTFGKQNSFDKYLLISYERHTEVMQFNGDNIDTIVDAPFQVSETTLATGELAKGQVFVQVCLMSIVLVHGPIENPDSKVEVLKLDSNFPVASTYIVDPYVLLLTQNGRVILFEMTSDLSFQKLSFGGFKDEKSPVTAASIYRDKSGLFETSSGLSGSTELNGDPQGGEESISAGDDQDDLDAILYGDSKPEEQAYSGSYLGRKRKHSQEPTESTTRATGCYKDPVDCRPTFWLTLARENGNLYIYSLTSKKLVYFVKKFNNLPEILSTQLQSLTEDEMITVNDTAPPPQENQGLDENVGVKQEDVIVEVQIHGLGYNQARPVLSVMIDDTVVFYEAFQHEACAKGLLSLRWHKLRLTVVTRSSRFMGPSGRNPVEAGREMDRQSPFVIFYEKVGSLENGLFVRGFYPSLLVCDKGEFYAHPFCIDGPIYSFSTFNNSNVTEGFLYISGDYNQRFMRIAQLPADIHYDTSYPVRKVRFDQTLHYMVYLMGRDVFAVVHSDGVPNTKVCSVVNEEKHVEEYARDDSTFIIPEMKSYKLQLFSTEDWKYVPNSLIEFNEFEVVTCIEEVLLSSESTVWGVQSYLAVGTAISYGEEMYVRGRILIYEMIEVVPEEGMPTTRHRLKNVYDKEQKGPVTSMCHCNGFLLTGMGQKIFIWQFKDGMLNGVSFLDMHFYIHNLVGFGSLALACDMYQSLSLVQYQKDFKALSLVSRDLRPRTNSPMAAQFLLDRTHMGFVLADEHGNICVFNHLPETNESNGGERLILRAAINVGATPSAFVRVKGHLGEPFLEFPELTRESHTCLFCTLDGSFGFTRPLSEKVFRRLQMLQLLMSSHIPQAAGLNPRGARAPKPLRVHQQTSYGAKYVIDANLVFQYEHLSQQEKIDLAKNVGSSRFQIMDDIIELKRVSTHF